MLVKRFVALMYITFHAWFTVRIYREMWVKFYILEPSPSRGGEDNKVARMNCHHLGSQKESLQKIAVKFSVLPIKRYNS